MMLEQFDDDQPCVYCGRPDAHECAGAPVCDRCCIETTDIEIAYPKVTNFLQRIIEYRVRGKPDPAPEHIPVSPEDLFPRRRLEPQDPTD